MRLRQIAAVVAVAAAPWWISCTHGEKDVISSADAADEQVALAREFSERVDEIGRATGAAQISVDEVRARLARGDQVVFLDVREAEEYAVSSCPGARHVPPDGVDGLDFPGDSAATVVAYCTVGYRSGLAAVKLQQRLGRPVFNLEGGIIAWFNQGGEVVDPSGRPVVTIHAYSPEWEKYVQGRAPATPKDSVKS